MALSASRPERVQTNVDAMSATAPAGFRDVLKEEGLLEENHPYIE